MNTKQLSNNTLTTIVEGAMARFSAPDRIIIRAWADGDTLPQIAADLGLNLTELEERWEHHILPGLQLTVLGAAR